MADVSQMIMQLAPQYGVDPYAALAVAAQEGLGGGIGDQGTSFGPFQLHIGGSYPSSAPQAPSAAEAWAMSPAGIRYALAGLGRVSKGLTGAQAINAIVSQFERPANVSAEESSAIKSYHPSGTAAPTRSLASAQQSSQAAVTPTSANAPTMNLVPLLTGLFGGNTPTPPITVPTMKPIAPTPAPATTSTNPYAAMFPTATPYQPITIPTYTPPPQDNSGLMTAIQQMLTPRTQPTTTPSTTTPATTPPATAAPKGTTGTLYVSPYPTGAPIGRVDQGVDYASSFKGPVFAVGSGKVYKVDQPGTSPWGGGGAIYYKLDHPVTVNGRTYDSVYTAETGQVNVKPGERITAGQPIATTSSGWQESGFAAGGGPAAPLVGGLGAGTQSSQAGRDFLSFINQHMATSA